MFVIDCCRHEWELVGRYDDEIALEPYGNWGMSNFGYIATYRKCNHERCVRCGRDRHSHSGPTWEVDKGWRY